GNQLPVSHRTLWRAEAGPRCFQRVSSGRHRARKQAIPEGARFECHAGADGHVPARTEAWIIRAWIMPVRCVADKSIGRDRSDDNGFGETVRARWVEHRWHRFAGILDAKDFSGKIVGQVELPGLILSKGGNEKGRSC